MLSPATLPDWPPPDGEPIGDERARAYIAWIREHAPPVLAEAEAMLNARYPGAGTKRASVKAEVLARWSLSPRMEMLAIGCVWVGYMAGSFAMVDIVLMRDGRLVARPGINMR